MNNNVSSPAPRRLGLTLFLATLVLAVSFILSAFLIARGYERSKDGPSFATFTGEAWRVITSDKAKWSLELTRKANSTAEASRRLTEDGNRLRKLMKDSGIEDADFSFHPVTVYQEYDGPRISQIVVITSSHAETLGVIAQTATQTFAEQGANLNTQNIEFYYKDLSSLQKTLAKEAIQDAQNQADSLLHDHIGTLSSISPTNIIVSPEDGFPNGYYGSPQDASSIQKKVYVNLQVTYRLK